MFTTIDHSVLTLVLVDGQLTHVETIRVSSSEETCQQKKTKTLIVHITFPVHFFLYHKEGSQKKKPFNCLPFKGILMFTGLQPLGAL